MKKLLTANAILLLTIIAILGWLLKKQDSTCIHYHYQECPESEMIDQITSIIWEGDELIHKGKTYTLTPMGTLRKLRDCGCECLNK